MELLEQVSNLVPDTADIMSVHKNQYVKVNAEGIPVGIVAGAEFPTIPVSWITSPKEAPKHVLLIEAATTYRNARITDASNIMSELLRQDLI